MCWSLSKTQFRVHLAVSRLHLSLHYPQFLHSLWRRVNAKSVRFEFFFFTVANSHYQLKAMIINILKIFWFQKDFKFVFELPKITYFHDATRQNFQKFLLIAGKFSGHIPSFLFLLQLEFTTRWPAFKAIQVMSMWVICESQGEASI